MANETKFAGLSALQTFLDRCKEIFASMTHKHTVSDISDYVVDDALSSTSTNPVQNSVLNTEFNAVKDTIAQKTQVQIITLEADD